MPINKETLNQKLYNELRTTEAEVIAQDTEEGSVLPKDAEIFRFHFIRDNVDYGEVTASIDGTRQLVLWYDNRVANSPKHFRDGSVSWEDLTRKLKAWGQAKQLSFDLQPSTEIDKLKADLLTRKQNDSLTENYHAVNKKTSYNDSIPSVKVRIQHNREMQEGEQRFRAVEKIFIENTHGERILVPTTKPGIAGIYGRHIAEGGKPNDERWNHITSLVEEYTKMAGFVRATRGNQFNESTQQLVTEGVNHYLYLRESLSKMRGKKGYTNYFESWTPQLMEDEVTEDISSMFMSSSLDPRIESVMPILTKLNKTITTEAKLSEIHEFEQWADSMLTFETKDTDEADYDDDYQEMVKRVGKKAKEQEQKKQPEKTDESLGAEQKAVGQFGPTEKISKSNPTRGKLVGESETIDPLESLMRLIK